MNKTHFVASNAEAATAAAIDSALEASTHTLRGVIFDLDGTLVDSRLDFDRMKEEIGVPHDEPLLEWVERMPEGEKKKRAWDILFRHEMEGAMAATLIPGVAELLARLDDRGLKMGILTRNTVEPTHHVVERLFEDRFTHVITRDDAPPKPNPAGLLMICEAWGCRPAEAIFVGDYFFDVRAGRNAGMKTVLYAPDEIPDYAHEADHVAPCLRTFAERFDHVIMKMGLVADQR